MGGNFYKQKSRNRWAPSEVDNPYVNAYIESEGPHESDSSLRIKRVCIDGETEEVTVHEYRGPLWHKADGFMPCTNHAGLFNVAGGGHLGTMASVFASNLRHEAGEAQEKKYKDGEDSDDDLPFFMQDARIRAAQRERALEEAQAAAEAARKKRKRSSSS